MNDEQLIRYSRHLLLNEFGMEAQERLLASTALVTGAGGLGSSALMYLATSGVGRIIVADADVVDLTNLQRQIIHRLDTIGVNKAESARRSMLAVNPEIRVEALPERIAGERLLALVREADVVLDCSDNFATRYAINAACVVHKKPLVSGAGIRFDGQLAVFDRRHDDSPCYHCIFPQQADAPEERCAVMGVFAPLVGVIGCMQAVEAIKLLAGVGDTTRGRLLMFDALHTRWHEVRIPRDPACAVCGASAAGVAFALSGATEVCRA